MLRSRDIQLICLCLLEATGDIKYLNSIHNNLVWHPIRMPTEKNYYCLFYARLTFCHLDFEIILGQFD